MIAEFALFTWFCLFYLFHWNFLYFDFHWDIFIRTYEERCKRIVYFYNRLFIVTSSMLMFERHLRKTSATSTSTLSENDNLHKKGCWSNLEYRNKTRDIRLRHPGIVPVAVSGVAFDTCLRFLSYCAQLYNLREERSVHRRRRGSRTCSR